MKHYATITVIGKDKTGVIARITHFLFEQRANIEALEEQVTRGQFSMTLQASWNEGKINPDSLRQGLRALGQSLKMEIQVRLTDPRRKRRVALLATREPHCLETLLKQFSRGKLDAEPAVVIANHTELAPMAAQFKVPFVHIPWNDRVTAEAKSLAELEAHNVDFVVLARFMKILSPNFVWRYKNKIINIHPSLLPSFPGPQAYRQAYEHGVKIIGVTAHFVSIHLDEGPIIAQECFKVLPRMKLKEIVAKGQSLEAKALSRAVNLFLERRLDVYWGTVREV
ncbi:MAG: formyltetrahydrofolate deformylase [Verrucomicrobia bacterium]|nr:formyltetrahydrofolate deformylase [Verrucomicrobiota bacterium]